jgi:hypothetical protein
LNWLFLGILRLQKPAFFDLAGIFTSFGSLGDDYGPDKKEAATTGGS